MKKVVIIGGGISGLICAWTLSKHADVTVLEKGELGGEFLAGGLKYIHRTERVERMFDAMDVPWSGFMVKGGILLRGTVETYPGYLQTIEKKSAQRIQNDHFRKTRRTEPGDFGRNAMNDPAASKPKKAIRCDFSELVSNLASSVRVLKTQALQIGDGLIVCSDEKKMLTIDYDYLVVTAPLWVVKRMTTWDIPDCAAMELNIAIVTPRVDEFSSWDYVYTPYTPANCVHRLSPDGGDYAVEANGQLDHLDLASDLNFLFGGGWALKSLRTGLKGHLLPLEHQPKHPDNVALMGRFACWEPRMTVDVTLDKSVELSKRWFGE